MSDTHFPRGTRSYDNARIESFHSIWKRELIYLSQFRIKFDLVEQILRYIHRYNHGRIYTYGSN
ncbi:integrase core domain-containing protein [Fructobacillus fructosus]|uniref:integrase core domain-containing protein n=1 Tax=Fructobacillus fructosus TaxID=1631 RepID=UPI003CC8301D